MKQLILNPDFAIGPVGGLPEGWEIGTRNPRLHPRFELADTSTGRVLQARGNGDPACYGWVQTRAKLTAGGFYRLAVRFRVDGIDDLHRHLVHGVFDTTDDGGAYNAGIDTYTRDGDDIIGETVFAGPEADREVTVRLYFRFGRGAVRWSRVSLNACTAPPQRLVKIAVMKGADPFTQWPRLLDLAGRAGCDIALLPEMFDGNHHPMNAVALDSPPVCMMADKAKQHRMYVAGALYLQRDGRLKNATPIFDRTGQLLGVHDKVVLFDPECDNGASPGEAFNVFNTDFGVVGVMTCYESWFPATAQLLALKGAELILFPSAGYYEQLLHARAADNGVVIAASSLGGAADVWDTAGNRASGADPDPSRHAPTNITAVEPLPDEQMLLVTVDLSRRPSPHCWGGPMKSAPGGRPMRNTAIARLEDEIARLARR